MNTFADFFYVVAGRKSKKRRQSKDLKGLPLRKTPDLPQKKEQHEGKQAR
ncbi:hypothetical protein [Erwinia pyrifoliae]|nr:hypothetical protein [Erwinia pyrifoliae]UXK12313.1 hypothetical protein NYP80_19015 [Erwinia pyrifoliae]